MSLSFVSFVDLCAMTHLVSLILLIFLFSVFCISTPVFIVPFYASFQFGLLSFSSSLSCKGEEFLFEIFVFMLACKGINFPLSLVLHHFVSFGIECFPFPF